MSDEQHSGEEPPEPARGRSGGGGEVEGMVDDVFGVDFKVPRTIRDLLVRPRRVYDAAVAGDHSRYTRPLRLFFALAAVQTLLYGWVGLGDAQTFSISLAEQPARLAAVRAQLAEVGWTIEDADELIRTSVGWTNWPITVLASLIFVLVIWAMRPRLGLMRALLIYVMAANASAIAALPIVTAAAPFGVWPLSLAGVASAIVFVVYLGLVMYERAADTAVGLAARIVVASLTFIPMAALVTVMVLATFEIAFRTQAGLSWLALITAMSGPS